MKYSIYPIEIKDIDYVLNEPVLISEAFDSERDVYLKLFYDILKQEYFIEDGANIAYTSTSKEGILVYWHHMVKAANLLLEKENV